MNNIPDYYISPISDQTAVFKRKVTAPYHLFIRWKVSLATKTHDFIKKINRFLKKIIYWFYPPAFKAFKKINLSLQNPLIPVLPIEIYSLILAFNHNSITEMSQQRLACKTFANFLREPILAEKIKRGITQGPDLYYAVSRGGGKHLQDLDLSIQKSRFKPGKIEQILNACPHLTKISLPAFITNQELKSILQKLTKLKMIIFDQITEQQLAILSEPSEFLQKLHTFQLNDCSNLTNRSLQVLSKITNLHTLKLAPNFNSDLVKLGQQEKKRESQKLSIQALVLQNYPKHIYSTSKNSYRYLVDENQAYGLSALLASCTKIHTLDLSHLMISQTSLEQIILSSLNVVDLSITIFRGLDDSLISILQQCVKLKKIKIINGYGHPSPKPIIKKVLQELSFIEELYLESKDLSFVHQDEKITNLIKKIHLNIEYIDLDYNPGNLVQLITHLSNLETLIITTNYKKINAVNSYTILNAIAKFCPNLQKISLKAFEGVTAQDLKHLLSTCKNLNVIYLRASHTDNNILNTLSNQYSFTQSEFAEEIQLYINR